VNKQAYKHAMNKIKWAGRTKRMIEFGQKEEFVGFCPVCGLPLLVDGKCKKYHRVVKKERIGRYSGKSKTPYGKYEDR